MAEAEERRSNREVVRIVGIAALVLVFLLFALDNRHSVRVGFIVTDREPPLIWVLLATLAIGVVLGRLWSWRSRRSR